MCVTTINLGGDVPPTLLKIVHLDPLTFFTWNTAWLAYPPSTLFSASLSIHSIWSSTEYPYPLHIFSLLPTLHSMHTNHAIPVVINAVSVGWRFEEIWSSIFLLKLSRLLHSLFIIARSLQINVKVSKTKKSFFLLECRLVFFGWRSICQWHLLPRHGCKEVFD